jgi:hypothetical protein
MADFTYNNHTLCEGEFVLFQPIPLNLHNSNPDNISADSIPLNLHNSSPENFPADSIPLNLHDSSPLVDAHTGGPFTCRMKGFDNVLNTWVYWSSAGNDPTGRNYRGPGTVSRVVVAFVFPTGQQAASL